MSSMQGQSLSKAILDKCDAVSKTLKSLSSPIRLKILCQLLEKERNVNELTEFCGISQSAMSQFLARLKAEGVLSARREGHNMFYSIKDTKVQKLMQAIKKIYC